MKHLAIFDRVEIIEKILEGKKLLESRFCIKKALPYEKIKKGDEIYLKESGGLIKGRVEVDNVLFFENLTPEKMGKLRKEYGKDLTVDDAFWKRYGKSKYASLIFLRNPQRFLSSVKFNKKDRRAWVIMEKGKEKND